MLTKELGMVPDGVSKSSETYNVRDTNEHLIINQIIGGVVVITTAQLHSTKPKLQFCASSNAARGLSEICNGKDL